MPRVLAVDPLKPEASVVAEAARVLREGGLVAFPTETVYGLGACALDERAVLRVFSAKGRPLGHPLIAHVEGQASARVLSRDWPEMASRLADAFWPGPLTLVVDGSPQVPDAVSGEGDSIAVRAPSHPVAQALIGALGSPIAAPSANRHQQLSPTTAAHVIKQLGDAVDLVLDGGACDAGIESTVVDVRRGAARVLRPGSVSVTQLRAILSHSDVSVQAEQPAEQPREGAPRSSPGMGSRHYAPRAPMLLADTIASAQSIVRRLSSQGTRAGAVVYEEVAQPPWPEDCVVKVLARVPADYARAIYATLHELDECDVGVIVVVRVPEGDAWWAIADRLRRGAT